MAPNPAIGVLLFVFFAYSVTAEQQQRRNHQGCNEELKRWIRTSSRRFLRTDPENATLTVDWTNLNFELKRKECDYDQLWLELWRIKEGTPERVDGEQFGSEDYFSKFQRCKELDEDLFTFHSSVPLSGASLEVKAADDSEPTFSTFLHVIGENYILRLCPCGQRNNLHRRICDCDYYSFGDPHCSHLIKLRSSNLSEVYPWCLPEAEAEERERFHMDSPGTTCSTLMLSGSVYSCTPIRVYDKIRVTLHAVDVEKRIRETRVSRAEDLKCDPDRDFAGLKSPPSKEQVLTKGSDIEHGLGEFNMLLESLPENSTFCVQVELVNHPYCNSHHIVGGYSLRQPEVCINNVRQPVSIPSCLSGSNVEVSVTTPYGIGTNVMFGFLVALLVVALAIALVLGVAYRNGRLRALAGRSLPLPAKMNGSSLTTFDTSTTTNNLPRGVDVLILYFPETKWLEDTCGVLRDYLNSNLGCKVYDLSDSSHAEGISEDPEGWVMGILNRDGIRILIVESPFVREVLEIKTTLEKEGAETADLPMPESAVEDSCHELRMFALRQVQSRFTGKYKELVTVRFDGCCDHGQVIVAQVLTPHKQSLVLPEHLPELRSWLLHGRAAGTLLGRDSQPSSPLLQLSAESPLGGEMENRLLSAIASLRSASTTT